ncbi:MAG: hypothetical protein R3B09_14305 [Nannocystaceae bacterium]
MCLGLLSTVALIGCNGDDGVASASDTEGSSSDSTSTLGSTTATSTMGETVGETTSMTSTSTSTSTTATTTTMGTTATTDMSTTDMTTTGVVTDSSTDSTSTSTTTDSDTDTTTGGIPCGDDFCPNNFLCKYDTCIPDLGACSKNDDCPGDSYCDMDGQCIPYGVPPDVINDPTCQKEDLPNGVKPVVQCEWTGPTDPNDKTSKMHYIYTTPLVADLNLDDDPKQLSPSVVVSTWRTHESGNRIGMLRVFDGETCEEQMRIGGEDEANYDNRMAYGAQLAIADLDGDVPNGGHPEIIGLHRESADTAAGAASLIAFRVNNDDLNNPKLERIWRGRDCNNNNTIVTFGSSNALHGPSIVDLDDDGIPEIVQDQMVFAANGCLLANAAYLDYSGNIGVQSAVVDVDLDNLPDLVRYDRIAGWNANTKQWTTKNWFFQNASQKAGHVAIANAGTYSSINGKDINKLPEVVVVSSPTTNATYNTTGEIRLMALNGSTVWGPVPIYKGNQTFGGRGGPATISDFDNDGQVEFAAAGAYFFGVYDPDCAAQTPAQRPGGKCDRSPDQQAKNLPDGVLWVQPSSDWSSNMTGSSVFDFNGDGKAEVVYRDECFVRVYDGASGDVLFSAGGFSLTGIEYPTVADVDGDFKSEIVVPRTLGAANCPTMDPLFPTATLEKKSGFVIYRDPEDRWANSRYVWNQHAYYITNVNDDATVPASKSMLTNWLVAGLNNFRQNVQGAFGLLDIADLTVELTDLGKLCEFNGGMKTLSAEVCNRGTAPVQDGVEVAFLETDNPNDPIDQATVVCTAQTQTLLNPGDCEVVSCDANLKGTGNIYVDVDPNDTISDCHPGNNLGADAFDICPG